MSNDVNSWGGFGGGLVVGIVAAPFLIVGLLLLFNGTKGAAVADYNRCIDDGGVKDHCVQKYLLFEKKP